MILVCLDMSERLLLTPHVTKQHMQLLGDRLASLGVLQFFLITLHTTWLYSREFYSLREKSEKRMVCRKDGKRMIGVEK